MSNYRDGLRYSTDLTDTEWDVIAPLVPAACPLGRPRLWSMRDIVNGIFFVLRGGVPWRLLPKDLPPKSTVYGYFGAWRDSGLFASINHHLVMLDRERVGRGASPTAAVLDSHPSTGSGCGREDDGKWRAARLRCGQEVKGRKRQALVDTDGRALVLAPQPADVQDRDGAVPVLKQSRRSYPFIAKAFADAGYAGDQPNSATLIAVEIVRKPPGQVGFVVHPRRWVVERFSPGSAAIGGEPPRVSRRLLIL